ncbi:MAG: endolytic transglycosylase MltG [Bacilli bacterium]|nr:endolytic transglycosylase MltG [Bacilli bacterium]
MKKRYLLPIITIIVVLALVGGCYYLTMPVQGQSEKVEFKINDGDHARAVIKNLKKAKLIKSEYFALLYYKMNSTTKHPISFKAGDYDLNKADSLRDIFDTLNDSTAAIDKDSKKVTFPEGGRLTDFASKIASSYGIEDVNSVVAQMDDPEFVQKMIDKYDIVTASVLNENIKHPLEGYLYGDTYYLKKDATVQEITEKLVSTMNDKVLSSFNEYKYKGVNYHDILAVASIVEHEGPSKNTDNYKEELQGVAQVFLNRIAIGMTLGSDVTTYYSANKRIGSDTLTYSDFNICDGYNTRGNCVPGIPVGPISSASKDSIDAVVKGIMKPMDKYKDYYYFVADKNTNIHFSKTDADQQKVIKELRNKGLWLED